MTLNCRLVPTPPPSLQVINTRLEEVLDNKNMVVKALQYDVAKVSKAHNDLIRVYEAKVRFTSLIMTPEENGECRSGQEPPGYSALCLPSFLTALLVTRAACLFSQAGALVASGAARRSQDALSLQNQNCIPVCSCSQARNKCTLSIRSCRRPCW